MTNFSQLLTDKLGPLSNFQMRVVTAIVGITLTFAIIFWGGTIGLSILVGLCIMGILREYQGLILQLPDKHEKAVGGYALGWLMVFVNILAPNSVYPVFMVSFFLLSTYFLVTASRNPSQLREHLFEFAFMVLGLAYFVGFPLYVIAIRDNANGIQWVVAFLLIAWVTDTGAYQVGRKYGKRPLYPLISPKKTLEGAGAGILAAVVIMLFYKLIFFKAASWFFVFISVPIVSVANQIGDLLESMIKRAFNIKDSGNLLPGHGGLMDRLDGIVFSAPVMYFLIRVFG